MLEKATGGKNEKDFGISDSACFDSCVVYRVRSTRDTAYCA
jgi:hypothetical protein